MTFIGPQSLKDQHIRKIIKNLNLILKKKQKRSQLFLRKFLSFCKRFANFRDNKKLKTVSYYRNLDNNLLPLRLKKYKNSRNFSKKLKGL